MSAGAGEATVDRISSFPMDRDCNRGLDKDGDCAGLAFPDHPFANNNNNNTRDDSEQPVELLSEFLQRTDSRPTILLPDTQDEGLLHPFPGSWTSFLRKSGQNSKIKGSSGGQASSAKFSPLDTIHAPPDFQSEMVSEQLQPLLSVCSDTEYTEDGSPQSARQLTSSSCDQKSAIDWWNGHDEVDEDEQIHADMESLLAKLQEIDYLIPRMRLERSHVLDQLKILEESRPTTNRRVRAVSARQARHGDPHSLSDDQLTDDFVLFGDVLSEAHDRMRRCANLTTTDCTTEGRDEMQPPYRCDRNGIGAQRDDAVMTVLSDFVTSRYNYMLLPPSPSQGSLQQLLYAESDCDHYFDAEQEMEDLVHATILKENDAATIIQATWRAHSIQLTYMRQIHMAKKLQTSLRNYITKKKNDKEARAARTIQSAVLSLQAHDRRRLRAIASIQHFVHSQVNAKERTKELSKIDGEMQLIGLERKNIFVRRAANQDKADEQVAQLLRLASKDDAAYVEREKAKDICSLSTGAPWQVLQLDEHADAATKLQSAWRLYRARTLYVWLLVSITRFQSIWRTKAVATHFQQMRRAALLIQRVCRVLWKENPRPCERTKAATVIQRNVRCFQARREKKQVAAILIQARTRGFQTRQTLGQVRSPSPLGDVPAGVRSSHWAERSRISSIAKRAGTERKSAGRPHIKSWLHNRMKRLWPRSSSARNPRTDKDCPSAVPSSDGCATRSQEAHRVQCGVRSVNLVDRLSVAEMGTTLEMVEGEEEQIAFANEHSQNEEQMTDEFAADAMNLKRSFWVVTEGKNDVSGEQSESLSSRSDSRSSSSGSSIWKE